MNHKLRHWALILLFVPFWTLSIFAQLNLTLESNFMGCASSSSGFINLSVQGGDGNYSYSWSNGTTNQDLTFVPAGVYSVTVIDGAGLQSTASSEIIEPSILNIEDISIDFNCIDSALVTLTLDGGSPPYDIQWSTGATGLQNILPSGNFAVSVYDDFGCAVYTANEVPDSFYVDLIVFDETCNMECDGSIFTSVNGGSGPYVFDWEHGADSATIFPLHSDTFVVTVTEGSGCEAFGVGVVSSPDPIIIEFSADSLLCGGLELGNVNAQVSGGFQPYSYLWSTGDTMSSVTDFPIDSMLTLLVFDSTGCYSRDTFFHYQYDTILVEMNIFPDDCGGEPDGLIFLDISGGEGPFSFDWSNNATSGFIFDVEAGDYSVTVTNEAGCTGIASGTVELVNSPLDAFIIASPPSECLAEDGQIVVTMTGGVGPYTYNWSTGATSNILSNLVQGIYTVTISDPLNCPIVEVVDLNVYSALDVSIAGDENICEAGDSIFLEASILSGIPPFTYFWNTGDTSLGIWVSEAGTYVFDLEDSLGCYGKDVVEIQDGSNLSVEIGLIHASCANSIDGIAWVNVYFETGNYTVTWSTGDTGEVLEGLSPGMYSVTVVDDINCPVTIDFEITGSDPILFDVQSTDVLCYGGSTGSALVDILTPGVTIEWDNGSTTPVLVDLSGGNYSFTLTDTLGCTLDSTIIIHEPEALILNTEVTNIDCDNVDGQISVSPFGGVAPYQYSWSSGQTDSLITVSDAGIYSVTVTDVNLCEAYAVLELIEFSFIDISVTHDYHSCFYDSVAIASAIVAGGSGNYSYSWSTGETTQQIENLTGGDYALTVCDDLGCCAAEVFTIIDSDSINAVIEVFAPSCEQSTDGYAVVTILEGVPGLEYYYTWSDGGSLSGQSGPLGAGNYSVTIGDSLLCSIALDFEIPNAPSYNYEFITESIDCPGEPTGSITILTDPAYPNSEVVWDNGFTGPILADLDSEGEYGFLIYYNTDCVYEGSVLLEAPDPLVLDDVLLTNALCAGDLGSILVQVSGGTEPYSFDWGFGADTSFVENLELGWYSVTVLDANECFLVDSFEIQLEGDFTVEAEIVELDCFGSLNGSISLIVEGGLAPYSFLWNTGSIDNSINNIGAGTYTATVCDANNCCSEETFVIEDPLSINVDEIVIEYPCFSSSNGSIDLTISAGVPPYTVLWSNGLTGSYITGLSAGSYSYTIIDLNGCAIDDVIELEEIEEIEFETYTEESCFGGMTGSINIDVVSGVGPFTILWDSGQTSFTIDDLQSGDYFFTINDSNNCFVEGSVFVGEEDLLECEIEVVEPISECEGLDGSIAVLLPEPDMQINWSTGDTTALVSNLGTGLYEVVLSTPDNCIYNCSVNLSAPNSLGDFIWHDVNGDGLQGSGEPGLEGVSVLLFDSVNQQVSQTSTDINGYYNFSGLQDGAYYIQVQDTIVELTFTLSNNGSESLDSDVDPLSGQSDLINLSGGICYEDLDAGFRDACIPVEEAGTIGYDQAICGFLNIPEELVEITPASGGSQPYEYVWLYSYTYGPVNSGTWFPIPNSNAPNYQPQALSHTTYFIRCIRSLGCTSFIESNVVEVFVDPDIVSNITAPNYTCVNEPITLTAADNGPGATYEWYLNGVQVNIPLNSLNLVLSFGEVGYHEVELIVYLGDCTSYSTKPFYVLDDVAFCNTAPLPGGDDQDAGFFTNDSAVENFSVIPTLIYQEQARVKLDGFRVSDINDIYALDVNGRVHVISLEQLSDEDAIFDTNTMSPGVYLINIQLSNGKYLSRKCIIMH
jgi:hypothetical protein